MLLRVFGWVLVGALAGCGDSGGVGADGGIPDAAFPDGGSPSLPSLVVDTDWLKANLGNPRLQPIDVRGQAAFDAGHIPGAIRLTPEDLTTSQGVVPSQVASPMEAEPVLRAAGLRNDSIAVVYGVPPEYDPARIVWTLRYYGHEDVLYLDGGYPGWVDAGGMIDVEPPTADPSDYAITALNEELRVTGDWVLSELGDPPYDMPSIQLVDARSPTEYEMGRIPNALLVQWTNNLDAGFLRSVAEIEALHQGLDPSETTVTYCLVGLRGSFAWLALTYLGYDDVRLYDGSWTEWGNGPFPIEQ